MSLRSWILDKLHPFVEGVTVTRFQYYVCVFFVLAFNLSVICLSLYLLGVLASNRMSVLGLVLIISESTLAMVLRIYQVSAVLGHPAHRRVENSGWLCYGYVLIPPLCIVGTSMLMLSLASHCSAVETACLLGYVLIGFDLGVVVAALMYLVVALYMLPNSGVEFAFPYHQVWFATSSEDMREQQADTLHRLQQIPAQFYRMSMGTDHTCAVCLEDMKERDEVRVLTCSHVYHRPCVDEWLSRSSRCPLCIRQFTPSNTSPG
jgi:hypothetical protein